MVRLVVVSTRDVYLVDFQNFKSCLGPWLADGDNTTSTLCPFDRFNVIFEEHKLKTKVKVVFQRGMLKDDEFI
jgi:hypothetical protein